VGQPYSAFGRGTFAANEVTLVVGFAVKTSATGRTIFRALDSTTVQWDVHINGSSQVAVRNSAGTELATSTTTVGTTDWCYVEAKVVINDSTGSVELKINGAVEDSASNIDTKNTSNAYATGFEFGVQQDTGQVTLDDFYIDDADYQGQVKIYNLLPSGAGTTTAWTPSTGSNYACVDESGAHNSDTDYVSSSTSGQKDTYAMGNHGISGVTVKAVMLNISAKKDDALSRQIYPVVRSGGTDYDGSALTLTTAYQTFQVPYATDPATSSAWTLSNVDAVECGVKVV
jgi:hypothetical protein